MIVENTAVGTRGFGYVEALNFHVGLIEAMGTPVDPPEQWSELDPTQRGNGGRPRLHLYFRAWLGLDALMGIDRHAARVADTLGVRHALNFGAGTMIETDDGDDRRAVHGLETLCCVAGDFGAGAGDRPPGRFVFRRVWTLPAPKYRAQGLAESPEPFLPALAFASGASSVFDCLPHRGWAYFMVVAVGIGATFDAAAMDATTVPERRLSAPSAPLGG